MIYRITLIFIGSLISFCSVAADLKPGFVEKQIADGLDPSGIELLPDGRVLVLQKYGVVSVVENDILLNNLFLELDVDNSNERGLLSLVIDPDFEQNQYFYVFYTTPNSFNRVSRFTANGNQALIESELILYEFGSPSSSIHNGGAMIFGSDGKLYVSSGDGGKLGNSQNFNSDLGKVLRLNTDGSIPDDNPFFNSLTGDFRAIYAYGFRNPFSITRSKAGEIIVSEVGNNVWEEINILESGGNYGWPIIEGPLSQNTASAPANYVDPLYAYEHQNGACAIVGLEIYEPDLLTFPPSYWGNILFADFCTGEMYLFDKEQGQVVDTLAKKLQQLTVIEIADNGDVYYIERSNVSGSVEDNTLATDGKLFKISFSGSGEPFISREPQDVREVIGEDVSFNVVSLGENPLTYSWFVNGEPAGVNSDNLTLLDVQLSNNGDEIYCLISNDLGEVTSRTASLSVIDNVRPVPEIMLSQLTYKAGDTITYYGSAVDEEDGNLTEADLRWQIDFLHDDHAHPFRTVLFQDTGSFVVPNTGETSDNVKYRVYLNATDSDAFSEVVFMDVEPIIKEFTIETEFSTPVFYVDGKPVSNDTSFYGVVGIIRQIEVPGIQYDEDFDTLFVFNGFDEDFSTLKVFPFPEVDSAIYLDFENSLIIYEEEVSVSPNPSSGVIVLKLDSKNLFDSVTVYNSVGKRITVQLPIVTLPNNRIQLDLSPLKDGVYIVSILKSDGVLEKRKVLKL